MKKVVFFGMILIIIILFSFMSVFKGTAEEEVDRRLELEQQRSECLNDFMKSEQAVKQLDELNQDNQNTITKLNEEVSDLEETNKEIRLDLFSIQSSKNNCTSNLDYIRQISTLELMLDTCYGLNHTNTTRNCTGG